MRDAAITKSITINYVHNHRVILIAPLTSETKEARLVCLSTVPPKAQGATGTCMSTATFMRYGRALLTVRAGSRALRYCTSIHSRYLHHVVACHAVGYNSMLNLRDASPIPLAFRRTGIRNDRALICTSAQGGKEVAPKAQLQKATGRDLVLSPPALVVTREYEWANILVGFEQANKYTIRAAPGGEVVGFLAEESSIGRTITRNFLRTHRPFKATVFDKDNNIVFVMRRPMYLVSTSIFVETAEGEVLGEVHMNWHVWRRRYKLYVDKTQFANVDSGFLAVDFDMRDMDGCKMASVNKDFTGFARELFTDARQYVLRMDPSFGLQHDGLLVNDATAVHTAPEEYSQLKLDHRERAVILATAIAIDFDYFSLHSRGSMLPAFMPMPPVGGAPPAPPAGAPGTAGGAGTVVGADVLSDAMSEDRESDSNPYVVSEEEINDADQSQQYGDDSTSGFDQGANGDFSSSSDANQSEWATFEEPDHGFDESFKDESAWSADSGDWSADAASDESGGGGLFGLIRSIFFDD